MTTLWVYILLAIGIIGSLFLALKYRSQPAQVLLTFIGATNLWFALVITYSLLLEVIVPQTLSLLIFPLSSFLVMAAVIRILPKTNPKEKRKNSV